MIRKSRYVWIVVALLVLAYAGNALYSYRYFIMQKQMFVSNYEYFLAILDFAKNECGVQNGEAGAIYTIKKDGISRESKNIVDSQFIYDTEEYELDMESELGQALLAIYKNYEDIPGFKIYFDKKGNMAMKIPVLWEENVKRQETRQFSMLYIDELFDSTDYPECFWMKCGGYSEEKTDYQDKMYWYNWSQDYPWG